jgi:hypothetical protein
VSSAYGKLLAFAKMSGDAARKAERKNGFDGNTKEQIASWVVELVMVRRWCERVMLKKRAGGGAGGGVSRLLRRCGQRWRICFSVGGGKVARSDDSHLCALSQ